jgi:hopanoid biosynthesis associated protein HpnK
MTRRLIINADDFGLTPGINRAIAELHAAGALTSATLMANGPAFADAVAIAQSLPTLGVGCHIVLTDGSPVSPPETIPTLIGSDGKTFRSSLPAFFAAALLGRISRDDIYRESLAQIRKLQASGITVTHVDTHKHVHILPSIAHPVLHAAQTAGVPCVRNPFEQPWSVALGSSSLLRSLQVRIIRHLQPRFLALTLIRGGFVQTTDGTLGISATGNLNAATLAAILAAMPSGTFELVCHPGYNDADLDAVTTRLRSHRETERLALLEAFTPHSATPELISYKALP